MLTIIFKVSTINQPLIKINKVATDARQRPTVVINSLDHE
jgi:hypothetical protein